MGRAARLKAQRRNGRTWSTVNPWTGRSETFVTHLSDQALAEWEAERTELAVKGYPDRPPEIDTPTTRGWHMPSSAPSPTAPGVATLGCDATARALGTWVTRDADLTLTANLGRRTDGELVVGLVVGSPFAPRRMVATGFDSIEDAARKVRDLAKALGLPEPAFISGEQVMADLAAANDGGLAAA